MIEMGKILSKNKRNVYYFGIWLEEFNQFYEEISKYREEAKFPKYDEIRKKENLEQWKLNFLNLLNKYKIVMENDRFTFLLKAGYRTRYFFNPNYLITRYELDAVKNNEIRNKFREEVLYLFMKYVLQELEHIEGKDKIQKQNYSILLFGKPGGEDPGTMTFGDLFQDLKIPIQYLLPFSTI